MALPTLLGLRLVASGWEKTTHQHLTGRRAPAEALPLGGDSRLDADLATWQKDSWEGRGIASCIPFGFCSSYFHIRLGNRGSTDHGDLCVHPAWKIPPGFR